MNVTSRAWLTDPVECGPAAGFGLYLHVPFCHHRCGYCDFATAAVGSHDEVARERLYDRYLGAITADLERQVRAGAAALAPAAVREEHTDAYPTVTSIFIGGGTPTLLGPARLTALLGRARSLLDVADHAEVTVECNPETASVSLFAALVAAGVTRVSMGAQSFAPHVLETLERGHDRDRPLVAVSQARDAGIPEVNLDLIFGTPGETAADWDATLRTAVAADIDHVSAYALTIHDNTPFGRAVRDGSLPAVDDDVQRDRFDAARDLLGGAGFDHYEVSNWARDVGRRSRHNLLYWRHGDYLAVGVGAHGHLDGRRWWTTRATERYLHAIESGASPVAGSEELDDDERAEERLLLGLRVREGLHPSDLPPIDPLALEDALDVGLVETACGRVRCTDTGWFLLDEAVARLR